MNKAADPELIRWAWRDAIEIERWRRTWRAGKFVSDDEVELDEIDWDDAIVLIRSFAGRPGIGKLEWHLERALRIRAGHIDWDKERSDRDRLDHLLASVTEDDRLTDEQDEMLVEMLGRSSMFNPFYGWHSLPAPGWEKNHPS